MTIHIKNLKVRQKKGAFLPHTGSTVTLTSNAVFSDRHRYVCGPATHHAGVLGSHR
jgi:hypothetical protein